MAINQQGTIDITKKTQEILKVLFGNWDDLYRLKIQFEVAYEAYHKLVFHRLLFEFRLLQTIKDLRDSGEKARILDVGCSEGWYLRAWYHLLKGFGLIDSAELYGADINLDVIRLAEEKMAERGFKANFIHHDADTPIRSNLNFLGETNFDLIYLIYAAEYFKFPELAIKDLLDCLNPGGFMYLFNVDTANYKSLGNEDLGILLEGAMALVRYQHGGINISAELPTWAQSVGCKMLDQETLRFKVGGPTPADFEVLRDLLFIIKNGKAGMVKLGLISAEEYDLRYNRLLQSAYQAKITIGEVAAVATIVGKPKN